MKVKLLNYTPEPEKMLAMAARICYDKDGNIDSISEKMTAETVEKYVKKMLQLPAHGSVREHASFTFGIEGVSRALSHQLVRHRIASYDQRSQRYCNESGFDYVVPKTVSAIPAAAIFFQKAMENIQSSYDVLVNKYKIPKEDARAVLPNACCTSLIMTMNLRSLFHFFALRCCTRAQSEIREMANQMLVLCKEVSPLIFNYAGPSCVQLGYCPEEKSCGRCKTLEELKGN